MAAEDTGQHQQGKQREQPCPRRPRVPFVGAHRMHTAPARARYGTDERPPGRLSPEAAFHVLCSHLSHPGVPAGRPTLRVPSTSGVGAWSPPDSHAVQCFTPSSPRAWIQGLPAAGTCVFLAQVWAASQGVFVAGLGACAVHGQHGPERPAASPMSTGAAARPLNYAFAIIALPTCDTCQEGLGAGGRKCVGTCSPAT